MAYKLIYNPLIGYIYIESMCASTQFYYIARLPVYAQWNGILWHASQIYMYKNAGYICDV